MPASTDIGPGCQEQFHRRWHQLTDPHVRALAWLIDAPSLLDPAAPQWEGRIAELGGDAGDAARPWLLALDSTPRALHAHIALQAHARLGRYAEQLMTFYLQHLGVLAEHNLQVRDGDKRTLGEFDFLVWRGEALLHWEFATKFYLLQSPPAGAVRQDRADYFVGPNLADSLGAKMQKIFQRQLSLSDHPAAQPLLPQPVSAAQALVKGWLFYPDGDYPVSPALGVCKLHCRGFWCGIDALPQAPAYAVLPRLSWLAPARLAAADTLDRGQFGEALASHFAADEAMPVLVALLRIEGGVALEMSRGFIVPDGWRERAGQRVQAALE
ncbi:MAG: DUF1853 family protein [Burkholderiaceae bacterium]